MKTKMKDTTESVPIKIGDHMSRHTICKVGTCRGVIRQVISDGRDPNKGYDNDDIRTKEEYVCDDCKYVHQSKIYKHH